MRNHIPLVETVGYPENRCAMQRHPTAAPRFRYLEMVRGTLLREALAPTAGGVAS